MANDLAVKRIGVLTSGGDAPGMNAAIRAVVKTAACLRIECIGIRHGYTGLLNGHFLPMDEKSVKGIIGRGGTMLYTARSEEFATDEGVERAADVCRRNNIEGLVVIGGDGSFRGARNLHSKGVKVIGIPCTIDNDIACTTYSVGYDTACNTVVEAVDKLNDTMQSHERCSVVEVMGRHAGHLALNVGIATGATVIMIPERNYDFENDVIERIRRARLSGRTNFNVIVAEGIDMPVHEISSRIREATGIETRHTQLGHVQRGGGPQVRDRVVASGMGYMAVRLLAEGESGRIVAMNGDILVHLDIDEALDMTKDLNNEAYNMFKALAFLDKEAFCGAGD
ncbi:MAG: 6-phosphofructokinase [Clostridiales bacterium]|nr:6-phosphofructokinase [Clostridiales bacterium]